MGGKTLEQFEQKHGGEKIATLKKQLENATHNRKTIVLEIPDDNNTINFGVCGDLHYGNIFERKNEFSAFCALCDKQGIKDVLVCGDVLDGFGIYKGQAFDTHAVGFEHQLNWFSKVAPKHDGMRFHFITGNHDASFKKIAGVNVGAAIAIKRPDWNLIGEDFGDISFRTKSEREYKIQLGHPGGGTAYAISYKMQKVIESLQGGSKPNMLCIGHFHKAEHLPQYRNVDGVQVGCFQAQTPFMKAMGTPAHIGGWIMRVTLQARKKMCNSVRAEFISFYQS